MANPQLDDGYIQIATEIFKALIKTRISGEEMQCLQVVLLKTYGFHKKQDRISLSQFAELTRIKKQNVVRALNSLLSKKIIVIKKDNERANLYEFNKDFDQWMPLSKKITGKGIKYLKGRISVKEIKQKIRERDNNICQLCGYDGNIVNQKLYVHHIDFNQGNNLDNNMITLCKSCHAKSHTIIQKDELSKKIISISKNDNPSLSKMIPTKNNTTKNTITKNNIYSQEAQKILDYLNQIKGSKYTKKDEIIARLKEGYPYDDFILIIENKFKDSFFIENPNHLNPITLFRKKHFDNYRNEKPKESKEDPFSIMKKYKREKGYL